MRLSSTHHIRKPLRENYPNKYHTSTNSEYRAFIKHFIDLVNELNDRIYALKSNDAFAVNSYTERSGAAAEQAYGGHAFFTAPPTNSNSEKIKELRSKIGILKTAVTRARESNFKEKRDDALNEIKRLETITSALNLGSRRF